MISLIAAAGENNEIGKDGRMPWNLPGDLQHFKALTLGRTMLRP
ncbi:MAG: dihydrofolate reductase [Clostridia bacterium]